jgi:hypothetical protein
MCDSLTHTLTSRTGHLEHGHDTNGGWPDNKNLIAGGSTDHGGGSDTILDLRNGGWA